MQFVEEMDEVLEAFRRVRWPSAPLPLAGLAFSFGVPRSALVRMEARRTLPLTVCAAGAEHDGRAHAPAHGPGRADRQRRSQRLWAGRSGPARPSTMRIAPTSMRLGCGRVRRSWNTSNAVLSLCKVSLRKSASLSVCQRTAHRCAENPSFMCSSVAAPTLALWLRAVALTSLHAVAAGAASVGVRILVALMKTREKWADDVLLYNRFPAIGAWHTLQLRLSPTSAMPSNQRFGRPGMYEVLPR